MHDLAARAIQERFISYAARDFDLLRTVLHDSASDDDRALAAEIIAYAKDKRVIVPDLVSAIHDPYTNVRNNAMRALAIIVQFAQRSPPSRIRVPYEPFVDLLNSPYWTDRNKSTLALMNISGTRDPRLFSLLARRAVPSLVEMATWRTTGHSAPSFWILGRVAGVSDKEIEDAWTRDDRRTTVDRWSELLRWRFPRTGNREPQRSL
jgi:hypothetical protein